METVLIILFVFILIIGFLGAFLPVLPGPPISYVGLLMIHFFTEYNFESNFLIYLGVAMVIILALDYFAPIVGAKKFGAGKKGVWGSIIGSVVGLFFAPIGIILGPLFGAIIGESLDGKSAPVAIKAGFGSFLGFLFGTLLKLIYSSFIIWKVLILIFS